MAIKPCQLVLIKRSPQDENERKIYEPEYYCQRSDSALGNHDWVRFQSNASVFNRSDAKRDLIPALASEAVHQIVVNHQCIPTVFEMVELIEKKTFGWVIFRQFEDGGKQYLGEIRPDHPTHKYWWFNSPFNSTLLDTELKDVVMGRLIQEYPEVKFAAQELFTQ